MRRLSLLFLLVVVPFAAGAAPATKQQKLEDLRAQIAKLRDDVEHASADRQEAADSLRDSERKISDVNRKLHRLRSSERDLGQSLDRLAVEQAATEAKLRDQEQQLAALLRQRYSQGGTDAGRLVLSGRDPGEVGRDLEYFAYIGRARAKLIETHKATLAHLADLEAQVQDRKKELEQLKRAQLAQREDLAQEKQARQVVYEKLSSRIQQQRRQIDSMVRDEARLSRLVERLRQLAEAARQKRPAGGAEPGRGKLVTDVVDASLAGLKFAALKGRLALPVAGEIVARYGQARSGGGPDWKGLFIRAKDGAPVRAVGSGEVVFADWLRGFGNLLIIDHGGGYMSLYSNNESLYKQVGDKVRAGDVVATVGNTGGQQEPGLYFELRRRGQPFDPLSWVK